MATNEDLMQRLAVSKKIMDKHTEIKRGDARQVTPMVENFEPAQGVYNIPEEILGESQTQKTHHDPSTPLSKDKILNSRLPDEIKRLMIEQPIVQPNSIGGGAVLSDDIIEGAQRLMGKNNKISEIPQQVSNGETVIRNNQTSSNINIGEIKSMIRDVVRDTVRDVVREELKDAGMIVESTQDTNEVIQFKVGQHLFIGRVTKIKKLEK
jgi:hypothetical protein